MLYLIEDRGNQLLKIGYTSEKSKKSRFKAYELHNPKARVLYEIVGSRLDEMVLHNYFSNFRYKGEWYDYDESIVAYFRDHSEEDQSGICPLPCIKNGRIYWSDFDGIRLYLEGKYGVNDTYLKVLFGFPDATLFNPDPSIGEDEYLCNMDLLESIFSKEDGRVAKSLDYIKGIRFKIRAEMQKNGKSMLECISEMAKTLLGSV